MRIASALRCISPTCDFLGGCLARKNILAFMTDERWFAEITRKRIRRGSFKSVADLIQAIQLYIDHNNTNPKPFVWTKRVDQILEKVARCKDASVTAH
jgi:hypothetical protein